MLAQTAGATGFGPGVLESILQFLYYGGIVGLLGATAAASRVFEEPPRALIRLSFGAWTAAAVGAGGLAIMRWSTVGDLGIYLGTPLGQSSMVRAGVLIVAHEALLVASIATTERTVRRALGVAALAASASAYGHVLASHASIGAWAWGHELLQWTHVIAVSIWIGGLVALLVGIRGATDETKALAVRRFSGMAAIMLLLVGVTGVIRALDEVGGIDALLNTTYGKLALMKGQILLLLAALGAMNRYRHVPVAGRDLSGLRRAGGLEVIIAAGALAVTSILSQIVPAHEAYAQANRIPEYPVATTDIPGGPTLYDVTLPDGSTFQVFLDPDMPGVNEVHVTFFDAAGDEMPAEDLTFAVPEAPDAVLEEPRKFSAGHYIISVELGVGSWRFEVEATPAGSEPIRTALTIVLA